MTRRCQRSPGAPDQGPPVSIGRGGGPGSRPWGSRADIYILAVTVTQKHRNLARSQRPVAVFASLASFRFAACTFVSVPAPLTPLCPPPIPSHASKNARIVLYVIITEPDNRIDPLTLPLFVLLACTQVRNAHTTQQPLKVVDVVDRARIEPPRARSTAASLRGERSRRSRPSSRSRSTRSTHRGGSGSWVCVCVRSARSAPFAGQRGG